MTDEDRLAESVTNINKALGGAYKIKLFVELADPPIQALQGISDAKQAKYYHREEVFCCRGKFDES
jgi:hypothetical protein